MSNHPEKLERGRLNAFANPSQRISVYITSFDQKRYLAEAIESVLNQTLMPYEIIIVDDCSTDGSQEIISKYAKYYPQLIKVIFHEQNMGVAYARNQALKSASGDYVTYLDGDDRFLPSKLEKEMEILLKTPNTQMVFSNFFSINAKGERMWIWDEDDSVPQGDIFLATFAIDFPRKIHFRNELVNLEAWRDIGDYDHRLKIYEDYDMRIRFAKRYRAAYNKKPSVEYRRLESGLSSLSIENHMEALKYLIGKNSLLLNDIGREDRRWLQKKIKHNFSNMLKMNSSTAIEKKPGSFGARIKAVHNYFVSLNYCISFPDPRLLLRILLPMTIIRRFMKCYLKYGLKNKEI